MKNRYALVVLGGVVVVMFIFLALRGNAQDIPAGGGETVELPDPKIEGEMSVEESIEKRRSIRAFTNEKLTLEQIGQIAWSAQGITDARRNYRAAPSAGALYPLELFLVTPEGVYHYRPSNHAMVKVIDRDVRDGLMRAALGQRFVGEAPLNVVITAVFERVTRRYGDRGNRYVEIEVGHAGQNIHLQAVAMGLGSVPVGAFEDDAVSRLLNLPDDHAPLYIIPVGHPR